MNNSHPHYDCYNAVLNTVAQKKKMDLRLSQLCVFGTNYRLKDCSLTLDSAVLWHNKIGYQRALKNFCGLYVLDTATNQIPDVEQKILRSLEAGQMIGVAIDSYHLPWNTFYHKLHRDHIILLTGINNSQFVCQDPYLSIAEATINCADIVNHIKNIFEFFFYKKNPKILNINNIIAFEKEIILPQKNRSLDSLNRFANDIFTISLPSEVSSNSVIHKIGASKLIFDITSVANSRNNFASALEYVNALFQTNLFIDIIHKSRTSYSKWILIKSLLTKAAMHKNKQKYLRSIKELINEIACIEEYIYEQIGKL